MDQALETLIDQIETLKSVPGLPTLTKHNGHYYECRIDENTFWMASAQMINGMWEVLLCVYCEQMELTEIVKTDVLRVAELNAKLQSLLLLLKSKLQ